MKTMLTAAALAASLATASAQDGYEDHYRAYEAAAQAGDKEAKLTSGEAAWRAAEAELGASETTAILAQNHLYDAMFAGEDSAKGAGEVAARALALGEQGLGLGNMTLTELRAARAYVHAAQKPRDDDRRDALLAALLADRETGRALNPMAIGLYRAGSVLAYSAKDYTLAYDYAAALTDEVRAVPEAPDTLLAEALIDEAAVLMTGRKALPPSTLGSRLRPRRTRYVEQLADAGVLLAEAVALGGKHTTLEAFGETHARAHAWQAVNDALILSEDAKVPEDHAYQGRRVSDFAAEEAHDAAFEACGVEWAKREVRYPRMGREMYRGAVFVGYHIAPDGRVEGARVLAEVPSGKFGPAVLEAMEDWRAKTEGKPEACLRDQTVMMKFIVR